MPWARREPNSTTGRPAAEVVTRARFAGDESLEVKYGKEAGFDELRFGDRSSNTEQRFAGKEDRALRKGQNIAFEAEPGEIVEKAGVDMTKNG
jgi:hypothetical protein